MGLDGGSGFFGHQIVSLCCCKCAVTDDGTLKLDPVPKTDLKEQIYNRQGGCCEFLTSMNLILTLIKCCSCLFANQTKEIIRCKSCANLWKIISDTGSLSVEKQ